MTADDYNKAVDLYSDGLYRFLLKKSGDEDVAKDLVQECFEKVWLKKDSIEAAKAKSYLFSTAFHNFIDHHRKFSKVVSESNITMPNASESQPATDLKKVLDRAFDTLPAIQKTVLLLRDYEGYNYGEIGEITELSESQVKVYIFRARKAMKKYLVSIDLVI